jgi:P27 family predicted phage terminase small subunit
MGRARKPVAAQTGNLTVEYQKQRELEEQLAAGRPLTGMKPPKTLIDLSAKKLWNWAVELLKETPLVGELDSLSLEGACDAFAMYRRATAEIRREGLVINGRENPYVSIQKKYAEEFRHFARNCGLTVDSRLKLAVGKAKDIDDGIEELFGDV